MLTAAISVSSGAAAIIAYLPTFAPVQVILALVLLLTVAGVSWYGHSARSLFGLMVAAFIVVGAIVLIGGAVGGEPASTSV